MKCGLGEQEDKQCPSPRDLGPPDLEDGAGRDMDVCQTQLQTKRSSALCPLQGRQPEWSPGPQPSPEPPEGPFTHRCAATHSSCFPGGCGPEAASAGVRAQQAQPPQGTPHLAFRGDQEAVDGAAKHGVNWRGQFLAAGATAAASPFPAGVHGHGRPEAGPA